MNNELNLKKVRELLPMKFFIPAYQRGYRWGKKEVEDLLKDIRNFCPEQINGDEKTWYCLQPVVVKEKNKNEYEVIDGQQRLTTLYIILHYLNSEYKTPRPLFRLEYETRERSGDFLSNLGENEDSDQEAAKKNIDFYYMKQAYRTINDWFKQESPDLDLGEYESKIKSHTRVIWYECGEPPIPVFTRINSGKIPLNQSELIRALFLNSSNFPEGDLRTEREQLRIANEWDEIEYRLRKDAFWYFLGGGDLDNRIELMLSLIHKRNKDTADGEFAIFEFFNDEFPLSKKSKIDRMGVVDKLWNEIKSYFHRVCGWYNDNTLYHEIGYLQAQNPKDITKLLRLLKESQEKNKEEFSVFVCRQIKESVSVHGKIALDDLEYGDSRVKKILLLYNVGLILLNKEQTVRFPFDEYHREKWDIDHITASHDADIPDKDMNEWIESAMPFLEKNPELNDRAQKFIKCNKQSRQDDDKNLVQDIKKYIDKGEDGEEGEEEEESENSLKNLTLLPTSVNRGAQNKVFPAKRIDVLEADTSGYYIPLGSKKVFLKAFPRPAELFRWLYADKDGESYLEDIQIVLSKYGITEDENK